MVLLYTTWILLKNIFERILESLDYYLESITRRMRKDFKDSMSKKTWALPSKIVGLWASLPWEYWIRSLEGIKFSSLGD